MRNYVIRRALLVFPTLLGITVFVFVLMQLVPGSAAAVRLGEKATLEDQRRLEEILGLDRPWYQRYFIWLTHVGQADFGDSYLTHRPVLEEIKTRLPATLELGGLAIIFGLCIALPVGVVSAIRQNTVIDLFARFFAMGGISIPVFWTGPIIILIGSLYFGWVPPITYSSPSENPAANLELMGVAAAVLAFRIAGLNARMIRSAVLEVLRQDYVRTAWAKGLTERTVITRHVVKNAMIPVITMLAGEIVFLVGGTVITETVFSIPGMGRYLVEGFANRDYPVVQGVILVVGFAVVIVNLLVDLSYGWFDPRIRY